MDTANLGYRLFDTAFGVCGIAWSARGLTRLQLPERDRDVTEARLRARAPAVEAGGGTAESERAVILLQRYFEGQPIAFDELPLHLEGVPRFFRDIYRLTRALRWGETATYGDLAQRAGSPGSARAVGQAMARNPIPIIIPCHRVLAANRKVGGFSAFGGTVTKERLLALEGISLAAELPLFADRDRRPVRSSADSRS